MLPFLPDTSHSFTSDLLACKRTLTNGSRTFLAASHFLPTRVRHPAIALYAFCREADDAIDLSGGDPENLKNLSKRLDKVYRGFPEETPTDRAFCRVVHEFAIPRALLDALIEGFAWDAELRRYETLSDVLCYATRVAGSVGAMMALLMGERSQKMVERACDLGIAMQLSNIARDVGEDALAGRIYLPLSWMREVGLHPEQWLQAPKSSHALKRVIERVLKTADELYQRATSGISALPWDCRVGIFTACFLYREIGHQVRRNDHDSVSQRAVVPAFRKVRVAARAGAVSFSALFQSASNLTERVEEASFLVNAIGPVFSVSKPIAWWNIPARIAKVIDIFERLEQEEWQARQERFDLAKPLLSVSTARA
ncbi:MAG: phytoene/squalene synthase family protein [Hyphomicrobium sp.]